MTPNTRHRFHNDAQPYFNKDTQPPSPILTKTPNPITVFNKMTLFGQKTRFLSQTHNFGSEQENNHPQAPVLLKSTPNSL
jgi:hypothetical protein